MMSSEELHVCYKASQELFRNEIPSSFREGMEAAVREKVINDPALEEVILLKYLIQKISRKKVVEGLVAYGAPDEKRAIEFIGCMFSMGKNQPG